MTSTVTPKTTATPAEKATTRAPRKPQDRQASKSEQLAAESAPAAGHELLTPVARLRSAENAEATASIVDLFAELGIDLNDRGDDAEEVEVDTSPATIRVMGRIGKLLESYVIDGQEEAFAELDRGYGAMTRMADLAMWYMGELGKSESSAS